MQKLNIPKTDLCASPLVLGTDYFGSPVSVDLSRLHRDASGYPVEEILQRLESFRQAGKIRCAGFANWTQARAEEARLAAQRLGVQGFVASQNLWSLGKVDLSKADPAWVYIDEQFVRWHTGHSLRVFPYRTQANGYFRRLEQGTLDQVSPRRSRESTVQSRGKPRLFQWLRRPPFI